MIPGHQYDISDACLGLPLGQALSLCREKGIVPRVLYTGERCAADDLTARVVAVRGDTLVAALFRDGDPKEPEDVQL
ncbi:MAG: hypothetical protein IKW00_09525 [Clostridia bacterium]|nr:hypothetical protein [Clostridia bacterium]